MLYQPAAEYSRQAISRKGTTSARCPILEIKTLYYFTTKKQNVNYFLYAIQLKSLLK